MPSGASTGEFEATELRDGGDAWAGKGVTRAVANVDGTFYSFGVRWTHRGCSLSEADLHGTTLECICHGSRFDVSTGDVLRGPAERSVQVYAVRVQGDALVVDVPSAS